MGRAEGQVVVGRWSADQLREYNERGREEGDVKLNERDAISS